MTITNRNNHNYLSQTWNYGVIYLQNAIRILAAIAIPVILSAALPMANAVNPEETKTDSELPANIALSTVQLGVALGGALGAAAYAVHALPNRLGKRLEYPSTSLLSSKKPAPSKAKVIHIPQRHWISEHKHNPEAIDLVWQSQIGVLDQLKRYPEAAVFAEGWTEKSGRSLAIREKVQQAFLRGIPKHPGFWSRKQKRILARYGAARLLFMLSEIPELHPTMTSVMSARMKKLKVKEKAEGISRNDPHRLDRVYREREEALLQEIEKFLNNPENQGRQIVIIYGANHDLSKYFDKESFERLTNERGPKSFSLQGNVLTI